MITIYAYTWNANADSCNSVSAADAYARLLVHGFDVELITAECSNENVGCEVETEAEQIAVDTYGSKDW